MTLTAETQTAPAPAITLQVEARFCDECGNPFPLTPHAKSVNQILCGPVCNAIRHRRRMKEASRIVKACIEWRMTRKKSGLVELCHLLDNGLVFEERRIRDARNKKIADFKTKKGKAV